MCDELEGVKEERTKRWQKVAQEACKQCRRTVIPQVCQPVAIENLAASLPGEKHIFVFWEEGGQPLKEVLRDDKSNKPLYLVIGPEGGLEEGEVQSVLQAGGLPVTLGPRILRTETAGLAALAAVMYQWGDLGGV